MAPLTISRPDGQKAEDEAEQRRALRRNRVLATSLLLVAAALFFASRGMTGFWPGLLHAGAEAAVVGGLADWFAVTALFRHPLGLPIPRTAILPRNKDRIGAGLGLFVERNFLAADIIAAKLAALAPARRLAGFLSVPENAEVVAASIAGALPQAVAALEDRELRDFVARAFHDQLREAELAPVLGHLLGAVTRSAPFDLLFDRSLAEAETALHRHADSLYEMVAEHSRWWIPKAIDRRIAEKIVAGLEEILADLRTRDSDGRRRFRAALAAYADALIHQPETRRSIEEMKQRLLAYPEMQAWLAGLWDAFRRLLLGDLALPRSRSRAALAAALLSLGRSLGEDRAMQRRIETGIEHLALSVVPWRGEISTLIAEVVKGWDAATLSQRIETAIGSDLQYIRMTGTLVGALIGALLYLASLV
jgi:uncharacterized membrane-anchored protein YjiN (DUF445 family)